MTDEELSAIIARAEKAWPTVWIDRETAKTIEGLTPEEFLAIAAGLRRAREALRDTTVHLIAAVSLLENTPKAKKAAASDTIFNTMLADYRAAFERGRAALASDV